MIGSQPARTCRKEGDYIRECVRAAHEYCTWIGLYLARLGLFPIVLDHDGRCGGLSGVRDISPTQVSVMLGTRTGSRFHVGYSAKWPESKGKSW